jgi:hypothetical protein
MCRLNAIQNGDIPLLLFMPTTRHSVGDILNRKLTLSEIARQMCIG